MAGARRDGSGVPAPHGANDRGLTATESSMSRMLVRRGVMNGNVLAIAGVVTVLAGMAMTPVRAGIGGRYIDPAQVVPLEQIGPEHRDIVAEVIRDHTF